MTNKQESPFREKGGSDNTTYLLTRFYEALPEKDRPEKMTEKSVLNAIKKMKEES